SPCSGAPHATIASVAHVAAIRLPEAAHGGFGGPRVLRLGALAAHVDHRERVAGGGHAALDEAPHAAVFHGDIARPPHQVALPAPAPAHLGRVIGEAEVDPVQLHGIGALGEHLAHREGVVDLPDDQAR